MQEQKRFESWKRFERSLFVGLPFYEHKINKRFESWKRFEIWKRFEKHDLMKIIQVSKI